MLDLKPLHHTLE